MAATEPVSDESTSEEHKGKLPGVVVLLVNLVASFEQFFILTLVGWPLQILLWVVTLMDVLWS